MQSADILIILIRIARIITVVMVMIIIHGKNNTALLEDALELLYYRGLNNYQYHFGVHLRYNRP